MWQIHFTYRINYQVIVLTIMWILFATVPLVRLRTLRWEWSKVQFNTWIAPFGATEFVYLMWGSINTNLNVPYQDGVGVLCLYTSGQLNVANPLTCFWQPNFLILFRFITVWLRGM